VKTKAGQILGDLKQKDFELREDGVEQNVQVCTLRWKRGW
jgi:hypothetical protein